MNVKRKLLTAVALVLSLAMFAGCAPSDTTVKAVGSTSVGPLMEKLATAYSNKNSTVTIEVEQVGSSAGIKAAGDGSADIGMSSRELKDEEVSTGLVAIPIALDGIAVIVNSENTVSDLTAQQITDIFTGKITNWKDIGGSDEEIILVSREEGSGTRDAFEELLAVEEVAGTALIAEGTGAVKSNVAGKKNAIGYISLGYMDDTVKALAVDGVQPSEETIKSDTYKVWRHLYLVTKGEAAGEAKKVIDYILSDEGQAVVVENHYLSVK